MSEARSGRRWRWGAYAALVVLFVALRAWAMAGQSLWSDELFSLAMATGHSLEHPVTEARPELGDYVESAEPVDARRLARLLEHDQRPAGPRRVLRAALLSDTSPPLYYLLLWAWTRLAGTGDLALRALSLVAALGGLPLLAFLARRLGGRRAVLPALALYTLAPASVHYSIEGRMYSLAWTIALAQAAASIALRRRRGAAIGGWALWSGLAAAGLLVHYFYSFVLVAVVFWLAVAPGRVRRRDLGVALAMVALVVAPWYAQLASAAGAWRVTAGWLAGFRGMTTVLSSPVGTLSSLFSYRPSWSLPPWSHGPLLLLLVVALVSVLFAPRRRGAILPGLWMTAACSGPIAVDFALRTYTSSVTRYALAGLPALLLIVAIGLTAWPRIARTLFVVTIAALWWPSLHQQGTSSARDGLPYADLARALDQRLGTGDLAVVQSIPSGVAGVARYATGSYSILSWVEPLGVRSSPRDLERWARGRRRVAFVAIHRMDRSQPAREWLERFATESWRWQPRASDAELILFEMPPEENDRER